MFNLTFLGILQYKESGDYLDSFAFLDSKI